MVLLRKTELFQTVLPSKIFEAMGAARPIILGVEGEAEGVVRAGECGLVIEPENAVELAAAVEWLKDKPEGAARLGRNGRALARRRYDRDVLACRYIEFLQGLSRPAARGSVVTRSLDDAAPAAARTVTASDKRARQQRLSKELAGTVERR
jgi:hypothetical protein